MASADTKRCLDCKAPLRAERSFVRCQPCVEQNMNAHYASEQGSQLAALRRRGTFTCAVCGQSFEAWARRTQQARTCSPKCRVKLHRRDHKKE